MFENDIKLAGKKQNIKTMGEVLMKDVDVGEPTSFFDHVIWVALKENVIQAKIF